MLPGGPKDYGQDDDNDNNEHDPLEDEFALEVNANVLRIRALRSY